MCLFFFRLFINIKKADEIEGKVKAYMGCLRIIEVERKNRVTLLNSFFEEGALFLKITPRHFQSDVMFLSIVA